MPCGIYADIDDSTILARVMKGYRMSIPLGENIFCPQELYKIMCQCWDAKSEQRPTFEYLRSVFADFQVSTEGRCMQENEYEDLRLI